jgi:hypothetical protein
MPTSRIPVRFPTGKWPHDKKPRGMSLHPTVDLGRSVTDRADPPPAERIQDLDEELDLLRRNQPSLFGHLARFLVMVAILLLAWYRVAFDGYSDALLYATIGGVGVWCAAIVRDVFEHRRRQVKLERDLDSLLSEPHRSAAD